MVSIWYRLDQISKIISPAFSFFAAFNQLLIPSNQKVIFDHFPILTFMRPFCTGHFKSGLFFGLNSPFPFSADGSCILEGRFLNYLLFVKIL